MNTQIDITENGTTTLATAGKYCDRNIDVNVDVSSDIIYDADTIIDGSFAGEYASEKITKLRDYAFYLCRELTAVSFPNCTTAGASTFQAANDLASVNLPNLVTITSTACFYGTKLTEIYLPNLTTISSSASTFRNCSSLVSINLPKLSGTTINTRAFSGCSKLTTLILGGSTLNPLANATDVFAETPIAYGNGYVYVPDDLVDTYKTATNWSTYADQIKPISELEE